MTDLPTILRQEIERFQVISFARFMELALYCPETGFYERDPQRIGRSGDFYTSVSVGSLFGELLAFQFAEWLEASTQQFHVVEAGAHDGQLASDILTWLREGRPGLFAKLDYVLVEPSQRRRAWQRTKLDEFAGHVRWLDALEDMSPDGIHGIIFSNELLDAFPVHVLRWDALERRWREWGVGLRGSRYTWERMTTNVASWNRDLELAGFEMPPSLARHLPDGFTVEISPGAARWWQTAAGILRRGKLFTIDYGSTFEELLSPQRAGGTLRAYSRHRVVQDVLAKPGEQDLTAHVNFTQLRNAGAEVGLQSENLLTQGQFLERIAAAALMRKEALVDWTPPRLRQFQTLVHPQHLGSTFRVLLQTREERRT